MGTPAYDLTFTVNLEGVFYENRHSMTVGGKDEEFSVEDLLAFAKENNIRDAKIIIEEVASAFTHFYELAMQCHVNDYWARRKSSLAHEIIERGRAKMSEENIKKIIEEYFVPLANKIVND